jgi:hypothetical protein
MDSSVFRVETSERSPNELGSSYINAYSKPFQSMLSNFRRNALTSSDEVNTAKTHATWPPLTPTIDFKKTSPATTSSSSSSSQVFSSIHPVGSKVGGIDRISSNISTSSQQGVYDIEVHPLSVEYSRLLVTSLIARSYVGLEHEYSQELRNHSAAQASLYMLSAKRGSEVLYFPKLTHMNLWQQNDEITSCVNRMASQIMDLESDE